MVRSMTTISISPETYLVSVKNEEIRNQTRKKQKKKEDNKNNNKIRSVWGERNGLCSEIMDSIPIGKKRKVTIKVFLCFNPIGQEHN